MHVSYWLIVSSHISPLLLTSVHEVTFN